MSGIASTFAIIALISLSFLGIYILQARERARIEKIQKIQQTSERYQRFERLLQELPPQYLGSELRYMLVQETIASLTLLIELRPSKRTSQALTHHQDYLQQIKNNTLELDNTPVRDQAKVREVFALLKILYQFVQQKLKLKQLDITKAQLYLTEISLASSCTQADLMVYIAKQSIRENKPRSAIHAYHKAIEAFKNIPQHPKAIEAVKHYHQEIKKLEIAADKHNQELKQKTQQSLEQSEEWDEFLTEDSDWKKNTNYDD